MDSAEQMVREAFCEVCCKRRRVLHHSHRVHVTDDVVEETRTCPGCRAMITVRITRRPVGPGPEAPAPV